MSEGERGDPFEKSDAESDNSYDSTSQSYTTDIKSKRQYRYRNRARLATWGRWSSEEHQLFLKAVQLYGNNWKLASEMLLPHRTAAQIRSHAQKYFLTSSSRALDADTDVSAVRTTLAHTTDTRAAQAASDGRTQQKDKHDITHVQEYSDTNRTIDKPISSQGSRRIAPAPLAESVDSSAANVPPHGIRPPPLPHPKTIEQPSNMYFCADPGYFVASASQDIRAPLPAVTSNSLIQPHCYPLMYPVNVNIPSATGTRWSQPTSVDEFSSQSMGLLGGHAGARAIQPGFQPVAQGAGIPATMHPKRPRAGDNIYASPHMGMPLGTIPDGDFGPSIKRARLGEGHGGSVESIRSPPPQMTSPPAGLLPQHMLHPQPGGGYHAEHGFIGPSPIWQGAQPVPMTYPYGYMPPQRAPYPDVDYAYCPACMSVLTCGHCGAVQATYPGSHP